MWGTTTRTLRRATCAGWRETTAPPSTGTPLRYSREWRFCCCCCCCCCCSSRIFYNYYPPVSFSSSCLSFLLFFFPVLLSLFSSLFLAFFCFSFLFYVRTHVCLVDHVDAPGMINMIVCVLMCFVRCLLLWWSLGFLVFVGFVRSFVRSFVLPSFFVSARFWERNAVTAAHSWAGSCMYSSTCSSFPSGLSLPSSTLTRVPLSACLRKRGTSFRRGPHPIMAVYEYE